MLESLREVNQALPEPLFGTHGLGYRACFERTPYVGTQMTRRGKKAFHCHTGAGYGEEVPSHESNGRKFRSV